MGYRSNIAYMILFPREKEYLAFLTEARTLSKQPINNEDFTDINGMKMWGDMSSALAETKHGAKAYQQDYLTKDGIRRQFPAIVFHAKNVKWYSTYPDVHAHESLMCLARLWVKCALYMVMFGEDSDDEELVDLGRHVAQYNRPMWVERRIEFHGSIQEFIDKEDV